MSEAELPIDIDYAKLVGWLVSVRLCTLSFGTCVR
jgi:hypothetical protein